MNYSILVGAAAVFLGIATSAFTVGLTEADHDYLLTQNVERSSPVVKGLSPKEQARLHGLINDSQTESDPTARAKIVDQALAEFASHQRWEAMNPGQLWDSPKRKIPQ
jgi:hypothetical protein